MAAHPAPASLLTDSHRRHIVFPYNDIEKAINAVYIFANSGFSKGESVVLIMADSHCEAIIGRIVKAGCDIESLLDSGQLECISADAMLKTFTASGTLDGRLVEETLVSLIIRAKANSSSGRVRIFGEMVSLLLAQNDISTAEALEELWNQIIQDYFVYLFCTYRLLGTRFKTLPDSLMLLHTHTLSDWRVT